MLQNAENQNYSPPLTQSRVKQMSSLTISNENIFIFLKLMKWKLLYTLDLFLFILYLPCIIGFNLAGVF